MGFRPRLRHQELLLHVSHGQDSDRAFPRADRISYRHHQFCSQKPPTWERGYPAVSHSSRFALLPNHGCALGRRKCARPAYARCLVPLGVNGPSYLRKRKPDGEDPPLAKPTRTDRERHLCRYAPKRDHLCRGDSFWQSPLATRKTCAPG